MLTQLLHYIFGFAVASTIATASYMMVRRMKKRVVFVNFIIITVGTTVIAYTIRDFFPPVFLTLISPVLFCFGGAFAERAVNPIRSSYSESYFALLGATILAFLVGFFVFVFTSIFKGIYSWGLLFLFFGFYATPSAIPTLIWVWQSSKLRPGIDRHLNDGDEPM